MFPSRLTSPFRSGAAGALALIAIPIGILAAAATSAFRYAIEALDGWIFGSHADITVAMAAMDGYGRLLIPALGGLVAGLILLWEQRGEHSAGQDYMDAVSEGDGHIPLRASLLRSLSSLASIVSAGSIGKEGAMVQLSALAGSLFGRRWADTPTLKLCAACGAAAGLASVYHAPLAGAMFVAEIVLGAITVDRLIPLFVASVSGSLFIYATTGLDAPFRLPHAGFSPAALDWALLVPIAALAGLAAPLFLALLDKSRAAFRALPLALPWRMAAGGLLMGLIAVWMPEVCGNGYTPVLDILHGQAMSAPLYAMLTAKVAATALIVGSGAVGGIFTPSLFIGAALGALLAGLAPSSHATLLALVGMGAFMAAVSHAPLMAILMVFEMTMDATLLLPLMAACALSYSVSRALRAGSQYAVLNRRAEKLSEARELETACVGQFLEPARTTLQAGDTLAAARSLFEQAHTRYLYLLDENGRFLGVVSMHRLSEHLYRHPQALQDPLTLLLEPDFPLLPAASGLQQAWDMFTRTPLERLPVVDDLHNRRLLGVVTKRELLERARCLRA